MKRLLPWVQAFAILAFFKLCLFTYTWAHPPIPGFISTLKDDNTVVTINMDDFRGIYPSGADRTIVKVRGGEYIKIQLPYQTVEDIYNKARFSAGLGYRKI